MLWLLFWITIVYAIIQKLFRGKRARVEASYRKREKKRRADEKFRQYNIKEEARALRERQKLEDIEKERASIRIQSIYRGRKDRRSFHKMKKEKQKEEKRRAHARRATERRKAAEAERQEQEFAASKIQGRLSKAITANFLQF